MGRTDSTRGEEQDVDEISGGTSMLRPGEYSSSAQARVEIMKLDGRMSLLCIVICAGRDGDEIAVVPFTREASCSGESVQRCNNHNHIDGTHSRLIRPVEDAEIRHQSVHHLPLRSSTGKRFPNHFVRPEISVIYRQ